MLNLLTTSLIVSLTLLAFLLLVILTHKGNLRSILTKTDDDFVSARGQHGWLTIGCSLYAGAVGVWCLTVPVQISYDTGLFAMLGYTVAISVPWILYLWTGPQIRRKIQANGFTALDFVQERYGTATNIIVSLVSLLYLVLLLIAELIAVGICVTTLCPDFPAVAAILCISIVSCLFSLLGGLPAILFADRIQSVGMMILGVVTYSIVFSTTSSRLSNRSVLRDAFTWESEGITTSFVLMFSCVVVEHMNQGTWQKIFAAKDERSAKLGFLFGAALMVPTMIMFGLMGFYVKAAVADGLIELEISEEGFFHLLDMIDNTVLSGVVVCLSVALVTSSANVVQTSFVAILAGEAQRLEVNLWWCRLGGLLLNIPAIAVACTNPPSILALMMFGNIVTVAVAPILFLGLFTLPTDLGAVCGMFSGTLMIFIIGWSRTYSFVDGLKWFLFPNGYNWECLVTFVSVFAASNVVCVVVSALQRRFKPATLAAAAFHEGDALAKKTDSTVNGTPINFDTTVPSQ